MQRRPGEGLGLSGEGSVERGHGNSNVRQASMVVVNHADELLQGLNGGGCWEGTNGGNFLLQWKDTFIGDIMAQEVDLFGPKDAFVVVEDETRGAEAFKDQMQVASVFFGGRGEDEDVINVGDTEGEIAEDGVYHLLKGGTIVAKAKTGVVESAGVEGCGDGGLWDVVWMHGDLVAGLQEVQSAMLGRG